MTASDKRKRAASNPAAQPTNPDDTLKIVQHPDESFASAMARTALAPELQAAQTIKRASVPQFDLGLSPLLDALRQQTAAAKTGNLADYETMLAAQAHTLDALGHVLARRSLLNMPEGYLQATELYMRLALRAFGQCRATVETLAAIKNPPPVAFVRQANIGQAVQVNNGAAAAPLAREKNESAPNELLEQHDAQRLDTTTTGATSASDFGLETVAAINRAA